MSGQMIDPKQGLARCGSQTFGTHDTGHHAADQAGAGCHRDGVNLAERQIGLLQSILDADIKDFSMRARGNFRHNTAEGSMQIGLTQNN